jgi:hypothetical protein
MESSSIRQVQGFTGPSVGLDRNAAPDIKDDSFPIEYSKVIFTEFVVTLLVEESSLYCHQYHNRASQVKKFSMH